MSKRIKGLLETELASRWKGTDAVAVISPRGFDGNKSNAFRRKLKEKGVKMTVVKNTMARRAGGTAGISGFESLLDGPSAVLWADPSSNSPIGISNIARILMDEKKTLADLEMRGIFFDGDVFKGEDGVKQVSNFPTREEAIADVLGCVLSAGANLVGAIVSGGSNIAGILSTIEDNKKESGEAA